MVKQDITGMVPPAGQASKSGNWLIAFVMALATALSMASASEQAPDLSTVEAAAAQKTGQLVAPWLPATGKTR